MTSDVPQIPVCQSCPSVSQFNEVRFDGVKASKVRVVFAQAGKARSGVSELLIWNE